MSKPASPSDLIGFLQSLPEGRKRRGVRYPQWLLLLMAILGILSGCRSARDLERFARRHRVAFNTALGLELRGTTTDSTFLYLLERVDLQSMFAMLRQWMLAQIAEQDRELDQLICDGKTLRGSASQPEGSDGATRFVTQVTLYARDLGVAIAQTSFDTGDSHERAALKELLSTLDLNGVLIQADALHTSPSFFSSQQNRGPTCS